MRRNTKVSLSQCCAQQSAKKRRRLTALTREFKNVLVAVAAATRWDGASAGN